MIIINRQKTYAILISLTIAFTTIRLFIGATSSFLFNSALVGEFVFYFLFLICLIISYPIITNNFQWRSLIILAIWYIYCYFMANSCSMDSDLYIEKLHYMVLFGSASFVLGSSIASNYQYVKTVISKLPTLLNILGVSNYLLLGLNGQKYSDNSSEVLTNYSMELSYANLVTAVICTVCLLMNNETQSKFYNKLLVVNTFLSYFLVIIGGSRGPIIDIVLIIIISIIYSVRRRKNSSLIYGYGFGLILAIIVLLFFETFFQGVLIRFRIFDYLLSNQFFTSSGRDSVFKVVIDGIKENYLLGIGVFHDRIYIFNHFHRYYSMNSLGSYPHNIVLEILFQFGLIIGPLLLFLLVFLIYRAYKNALIKDAIPIYYLLLGIGLFTLLVSNSYVDNWEFYMFIGFLSNLSNIKVKKLQKV